MLYTENEIDRESFLELSEADVKELVKPLGVVKKLVRLKSGVSKYWNNLLLLIQLWVVQHLHWQKVVWHDTAFFCQCLGMSCHAG